MSRAREGEGERRASESTTAMGMWIVSEPASSTNVLLCAPAKAGSTSFFRWLYERLALQPWPTGSGAYVHDPNAPPWKLIQPYTVRGVDRWQEERPLPRQHFALVRSPLARVESAFNSKVACGVGDGAEKANIVAWLEKSAPHAAHHAYAMRGRLTYNDTQLRRGNAGEDTPCLHAKDFASMLLEAQSRNITLNEHFRPMVEVCALDQLSYTSIPVENPELGLRALAGALRVPYRPLPHEHQTSRARRVPIDDDSVRTKLERVYTADLRLLRYMGSGQNMSFLGVVSPCGTSRLGRPPDCSEVW